MEELKVKAKNYYIIARISEEMEMYSEATSNYFKALSAIDDFTLLKTTNSRPKDHAERFSLLKSKIPKLYYITDRLFSTYRRTYTQELNKGEVPLVRKRVEEAFAYAKIEIPKSSKIKERFEKIIKKRKILD